MALWGFDALLAKHVCVLEHSLGQVTELAVVDQEPVMPGQIDLVLVHLLSLLVRVLAVFGVILRR